MNTKMKSRMNFRLSRIVGLLAVILLFAVPDGAKAYDFGYDKVDVGRTMDVTGVEGFIDVYGTLNLYPGADVGWIYALPGCTVNIYGGSVGGFILVYGGSGGKSDPVVTVYGTGFEVNGTAWAPPPTEFKALSGVLAVLKGTYCSGGDINLTFYTYAPVYLDTLAPDVVIDVKPGSDTNVINLKSKGVVPVAILTTDSFDAGTVDPESVQFAQAAPVRWKLEDVDGDGDKDMLLHFKTQELNLVSAQELSALSAQKSEVSASVAKKAKLTGKTAEGYQVSGSDSVRIISPKK